MRSPSCSKGFSSSKVSINAVTLVNCTYCDLRAGFRGDLGGLYCDKLRFRMTFKLSRKTTALTASSDEWQAVYWLTSQIVAVEAETRGSPYWDKWKWELSGADRVSMTPYLALLYLADSRLSCSILVLLKLPKYSKSIEVDGLIYWRINIYTHILKAFPEKRSEQLVNLLVMPCPRNRDWNHKAL